MCEAEREIAAATAFPAVPAAIGALLCRCSCVSKSVFIGIGALLASFRGRVTDRLCMISFSGRERVVIGNWRVPTLFSVLAGVI